MLSARNIENGEEDEAEEEEAEAAEEAADVPLAAAVEAVGDRSAAREEGERAVDT